MFETYYEGYQRARRTCDFRTVEPAWQQPIKTWVLPQLGFPQDPSSYTRSGRRPRETPLVEWQRAPSGGTLAHVTAGADSRSVCLHLPGGPAVIR